MLGRMRTSSLEELEIERSASSKLLKDDSLSVYETTLMKLKQGSRKNMNLTNSDSTRIESDPVEAGTQHFEVVELAMLDTCCTSSASATTPSSCQPIGIQKEKQNKNVSVASLFSRYKNTHYALRSPDRKAIVVENGEISCNTSQILDDIN